VSLSPRVMVRPSKSLRERKRRTRMVKMIRKTMASKSRMKAKRRKMINLK